MVKICQVVLEKKMKICKWDRQTEGQTDGQRTTGYQKSSFELSAQLSYNIYVDNGSTLYAEFRMHLSESFQHLERYKWLTPRSHFEWLLAALKKSEGQSWRSPKKIIHLHSWRKQKDSVTTNVCLCAKLRLWPLMHQIVIHLYFRTRRCKMLYVWKIHVSCWFGLTEILSILLD